MVEYVFKESDIAFFACYLSITKVLHFNFSFMQLLPKVRLKIRLFKYPEQELANFQMLNEVLNVARVPAVECTPL